MATKNNGNGRVELPPFNPAFRHVCVSFSDERRRDEILEEAKGLQVAWQDCRGAAVVEAGEAAAEAPEGAGGPLRGWQVVTGRNNTGESVDNFGSYPQAARLVMHLAGVFLTTQPVKQSQVLHTRGKETTNRPKHIPCRMCEFSPGARNVADFELAQDAAAVGLNCLGRPLRCENFATRHSTFPLAVRRSTSISRSVSKLSGLLPVVRSAAISPMTRLETASLMSALALC